MTDLWKGNGVSDWQPISNMPPPNKSGRTPQMILGHKDRKWVRFGFYYASCRKWYYSGTNERTQWAETEGDSPTHWMPMIQPPICAMTKEKKP